MSRWVTHGMWTLGSLFLELVTQSTRARCARSSPTSLRVEASDESSQAGLELALLAEGDNPSRDVHDMPCRRVGPFGVDHDVTAIP